MLDVHDWLIGSMCACSVFLLLLLLMPLALIACVHAYAWMYLLIPHQGKRVMIVDDVITAGTAIREAVALVRSAGGTVAGVVIALDRQEISGSPSPSTTASATAAGAAVVRESAVMGVVREVGCPVRAVLTLGHLDAHLSKQSSGSNGSGSGESGAEVASAVKAYRALYGV